MVRMGYFTAQKRQKRRVSRRYHVLNRVAVLEDRVLLTPSGVTPNGAPAITGTAGVALNNVLVATMVTDGTVNGSQFLSLIQWGDGQQSTKGPLTAVGNNTFEALGTHTYAQAGSYNILVQFGVPGTHNPTTAVKTTATISAATLTPTVTVTSTAPTSTYGQSLNFTVNVTGSGPTPTGNVQFVVDGTSFGSQVALVNGAATSSSTSTLTAGNHTIQVNYAGDGNYSSNSGSFTQVVNKAHLTVTAQNAARLYGQTNPAFSAVITGFVNGDTSSVVSGTPNLASTATAASPVGTYPITVDVSPLSATNYDFAGASGTLTVNKAHLTVTAQNASRLYGQTNPTFSAVITGFVNGDTSSVVSGTANLATTATAASPVGSYPITVNVSPLSATNYDFTGASGTLTVNKAHLTVTAQNAARLYGQANPTFSAVITGFVNGDTASVVSGTAGLATTATAASPVGSYPITVDVSPLSATNYDFTGASGTLTVNKAHLTVTAQNAARLYGQTNPTFSAVITGFVNGDTSSVVSGTAGLATTATAASPVGSYPITVDVSPLSASNCRLLSHHRRREPAVGDQL
jgi:hypothetical protein